MSGANFVGWDRPGECGYVTNGPVQLGKIPVLQ